MRTDIAIRQAAELIFPTSKLVQSVLNRIGGSDCLTPVTASRSCTVLGATVWILLPSPWCKWLGSTTSKASEAYLEMKLTETMLKSGI